MSSSESFFPKIDFQKTRYSSLTTRYSLLLKMKSSAFLLTLVFCCLCSVEVFSQKRMPAVKPKFALGIAPFSVLFASGKANLRGEWAYAPKKSLSLLLGIPRPTPAPAFVADKLDLNDATTATTNRFTSFGAILEHRFYLGENALRGFYLAPYGRFNNFSVDRTTINADNQYKTSVKGTIGGLGLGAAAGVQMRLGDFITLDATLVGLDMKWLRGSVTYATDNPENNLAAFREQVQKTVGDIPFVGSKLSANIEDNAVKVRAPGLPMPAYRFNLSLNFVF